MKKAKKKAWIIAGAVVLLGVIGYANYRHFVPMPVSFGNREYAVEAQPLTAEVNGHSIYGELLLPRGLEGKLPTVICSHGFGSSYQMFKTGAGMSLAKSGFAVYCFDFYGGSVKSKSGGSMTEMSVFTEQEDLNAVIDRIKTLETTDQEHLFLLGESQGGFVSAITAAERQDDIRGLILYYPALCIPDDAIARYATVADIPDTYKIMGRTVGRIYSEGLYDYDVYSVIPAFDGPVLIIHGDADKVVDLSYSERAAEVYPHAELVVLSGQGHGFTGTGKTEATKLTFDFIIKHTEG